MLDETKVDLVRAIYTNFININTNTNQRNLIPPSNPRRETRIYFTPKDKEKDNHKKTLEELKILQENYVESQNMNEAQEKKVVFYRRFANMVQNLVFYL